MSLKKNLNKTITASLLLLSNMAFPLVSMAQEAGVPKMESPFDNKENMLRYTLAGILILLLCVIAVLGHAVASAGKMYWERTNEAKKKNSTGGITTLLLLLLFTGLGTVAHAQETAEVITTPAPKGLPGDIMLLLIIISLEFVIVLVLAKMLFQFLNTKAPKPVKKVPFKVLFQKLNQTVPVEEEHLLDLQHSYDGIRELDNKIPAWWRYAFYATMVFSVVYLYRMFVSETLPDQLQELDAANRVAAIQKAEYLKNAANNIDENNVVMLDASGIAEGEGLFIKNCQACHGDKGQGGVGPNLTDDYWLHKGGIKDIFYSIKYGWQEKGMKSWKEDFSPAQIAQLASFVKSLHGTKPAGGKEPQGMVYTEATHAAGDTATTKVN